MAAWQFEVQFVRTDKFTLDTPEEICRVSRLSQANHQLAKRHLEELKLPEAGIAIEWLVYGDPKGNRFDLRTWDDRSVELSARIDATEDSDAFCDLVCLLALDLGCELWSSELNTVVRPTRQALFSALMSCSAWIYALDTAGATTKRTGNRS